jgi:hypothetical protein
LLEPRVLLATFTVTNTGDAGPGSVREAMTFANHSFGPDTIAFDVRGQDPGPAASSSGRSSRCRR